MKNTIATIIFLLFGVGGALAQFGSTFIKNYNPDLPVEDPQIWVVKQDKRGVMYFGGYRLFIYDGVNWDFIPMPGNEAIGSLEIDSCGTVYVGNIGNFGYLRANEKGKLQYKSLSEDLDSVYQNFTDVWNIFIIKGSVYFCTYENIFKYTPNRKKPIKESLKVYKSKNEFQYFLSIYDSLYIYSGKYMYILNNDSIRFVRNKEFASKFHTWIMLPYQNDKILCANRSKGLFIYDPQAATDEKSIITEPYLNYDELNEINEFIKENEIYSAKKLTNGNYVLGSLTSGIVEINKRGKIIRRIGKADGLQSATIYNLFQDKQGELWEALSMGMSRVEISSPFSMWTEKDGIEGTIYNMCDYNGKIYVGTDIGLYCKDNNNKFSAMPNFTGNNNMQCLELKTLKMPDNKYHLLMSGTKGIYDITDNKNNHISKTDTYTLNQSQYDSSKIYIADNYALKYIKYENGKWRESGVLVDLGDYPLVLLEENPNDLWTILVSKPYLIKVSENYKIYNPDLSNVPERVSFYDINKINGQIYFLSSDGFYKYENNKIVKDTLIYEGKLNNKEIHNIEKLNDSTFCILEKKNEEFCIEFLYKNNEGYKLYSTPFKRLKGISDFYIDKEGTLWICSLKEIYKMHKTSKKYNIPFQTLIRKVYINRDSLIFYGNFYNDNDKNSQFTEHQPLSFIPILEYKENDITFNFAMTSYDNEENNMYSYALCSNGEETAWSNWSKKTQKEYTNLHEGDYIFKVKGRNIFGVESSIASYTFIIKPPWYRTFWAYILQIIALIVFVFILVKLYTKRLTKENEKLENIVKKRTEKIFQQKEEIQTQAQNLQIANNKILAVNEEMRKKNKQLTDSIQYAKRIQTAAMPNKSEVKKLLPSNFIFFRPRDIVSGDYYWMRQIGNWTIVMAADCTGHGIPGAFMSMLGISLFNEIARRPEINNVAMSLDILRKELKQTLGQTDYRTQTSDGIDLSIIAIDKKKRVMQYAGANNAIFVIQDDELTVYKADKMPVGVYIKETPFNNHVINIKPGDQIYMFSDGYTDQFGGNHQRKFTRKRFEKLIYANRHKTMEQQYETLKKVYEIWAKDEEQLDDILVIGIRIESEMFE